MSSVNNNPVKTVIQTGLKWTKVLITAWCWHYLFSTHAKSQPLNIHMTVTFIVSRPQRLLPVFSWTETFFLMVHVSPHMHTQCVDNLWKWIIMQKAFLNHAKTWEHTEGRQRDSLSVSPQWSLSVRKVTKEREKQVQATTREVSLEGCRQCW